MNCSFIYVYYSTLQYDNANAVGYGVPVSNSAAATMQAQQQYAAAAAMLGVPYLGEYQTVDVAGQFRINNHLYRSICFFKMKKIQMKSEKFFHLK